MVTGEEEDRVTAGGWIQNALFSQRASLGRRWNDWPGTDGIGGVFSVAYAQKWSTQASDQIKCAC